MSANPVWCLFRVKPEDVPSVKWTFQRAIEQSQISEKLQEFLQNRAGKSDKFYQQEQDTFNHFILGAFVDKREKPDAFDWDDLHDTYELFFPSAIEEIIEEIFDSLFIGDAPIISEPMEKAQLEFVITNRVGATEILWGGLGWERASRLPGYFGNMFVLPEDVARTLANIEEVFEEVGAEEFLKGARTIGVRGNCNEGKVESLQFLILSALRTVLKEGNGLLALSYPHMGSMSFPEYEGNY